MVGKRFKIHVQIIVLALTLAFPLFIPQRASALAVGGRFLPGLFDIFTPNPYCGLVVSVIFPDGIIMPFLWVPVSVNDYFIYTPYHVGNSMLGQATDAPAGACPPILYMAGSSIAP